MFTENGENFLCFCFLFLKTSYQSNRKNKQSPILTNSNIIQRWHSGESADAHTHQYGPGLMSHVG